MEYIVSAVKFAKKSILGLCMTACLLIFVPAVCFLSMLEGLGWTVNKPFSILIKDFKDSTFGLKILKAIPYVLFMIKIFVVGCAVSLLTGIVTAVGGTLLSVFYGFRFGFMGRAGIEFLFDEEEPMARPDPVIFPAHRVVPAPTPEEINQAIISKITSLPKAPDFKFLSNDILKELQDYLENVPANELVTLREDLKRYLDFIKDDSCCAISHIAITDLDDPITVRKVTEGSRYANLWVYSKLALVQSIESDTRQDRIAQEPVTRYKLNDESIEIDNGFPMWVAQFCEHVRNNVLPKIAENPLPEGAVWARADAEAENPSPEGIVWAADARAGKLSSSNSLSIFSRLTLAESRLDSTEDFARRSKL